ncbi:MAG: hypothetical protein ABI311_02695, partial [Gemmatimonadaceae bacterium]
MHKTSREMLLTKLRCAGGLTVAGLLLSTSASAQSVASSNGPRFEISFPTSAHSGPVTGRVYVAISRLADTSGTPIQRTGETGDP